MNPQDIMDHLLAVDGQDWFLVVTKTGRAAITTESEGSVVGQIKCQSQEKNLNDDLTITPPTEPAAKSSLELELHVSSSH